MNNPPDLDTVQRDFFGALRMPLRGRSRRSTELPPNAEDHHPEFLGTADRHLRPAPQLAPAECLELYHRQYWLRLLDSIEEDFPGLARLLGRERFWAVIEEYLLARGSTNFTLRHLGAGLSGHLRESLADPAERVAAAAVAEIEFAVLVRFEAADAPPADAHAIAEGMFTLAPRVSLHRHQVDASGWLRSLAADKDPGTPDADAPPYHAVVWRDPEGRARHRVLEPGEFRMLSRLTSRITRLDPWLEDSVEDIPDAPTLSRWIHDWQVSGFLTPALLPMQTHRNT